MVYSIEERTEIIATYYRNNDCANASARIFNNNHPEKNVSYQYVQQLVAKFQTTGSIHNKKREANRPVRNEAIEVAVLGHVQMDNTQSIRKLSQASGVSATSVFRIMKMNKFHPFKIRLVQEINEDDPDRRLQFCEYFSEQLIINPNLLYNTCFSDECTFMLNGQVNRHNCRYWSDTNPHLLHETHTQVPQKLNVWAGILGDHLVGPFFIDGNLNGDIYLEMLEDLIDPMITEILENDNNLFEDQITFQQDGAPPHYTLEVRQFLDGHFPGRWIGRRGPIEWPPRSPDLTPLDFFVGTFEIKSLCHSTRDSSGIEGKNY